MLLNKLIRLLPICLAGVLFWAIMSPTQILAKGDTLTVAYPADPKTLDPHMTQDSTSNNTMRQIYESLVTLDEKGNIIPVLAEKWEPLEGNRGYTFHLKKGVKFHNGEELKASDVFFTFTRATSPLAGSVHAFSSFIDAANMKIIDDYTIVIPTKQPMGTCFLESMNHPWSSILNQKAVESADRTYGQSPVGTGRYKFVSWNKGDRVVMERFEDYHGTKAKIKNLIIRAVVEGTSRTIELESGAVDVANEIPYIDVPRIESNPDLTMVLRPGQVVVILSPDVTKAPYDKLEVRQAMNIAIDRKGIAKAIFRGYGDVSTGPVSAQIKYNKHNKTPVPKVDIAKAKELLAKAGYPNGFKGQLIAPDRPEYLAPMTVIQENLRAIGMDMELRVFEWGTYLDAIRQPGHAPFVWYHWGGGPALDPFFFLTPAFHSVSIGQTNRSFLNDPHMDKLLDKGAALNDGPERQAVYEELWDYINATLPWISVAEPNRTFATTAKLRGVNFTPSAITYYGSAYFE